MFKDDAVTPQQVEIVQETFALALRRRADFGMEFYRRLFAMQPELRPMFRDDIELQSRKLVQLLGTGVASLNNLASLSATLEDLGRRHSGYGVKPEHYLFVGAALISTFETCLGEAFDGEAREAWTILYALVSRVMKKGASPARQRAAA